MSGIDILYRTIEQIIINRNGQVRISPNWVATEALVTLDPDRKTEPAIYEGCHKAACQIAMAKLRGRFEKQDDESAQHELFPGLQKRYPIAKQSKSDPQYVVLEHMTKEDWEYNISRLQSEAVAKLAHADALKAWGIPRFAAAA